MTKEVSPKKEENQRQNNKVSWAVFLSTLVVVLISLTSVLFPSFVIRSASTVQDPIMNQYELGVWTYHLLVANLILLGIGLLRSKNKLPQLVTNTTSFILNFEISKKVTILTVAVLLAIYVGFSVSELGSEERWDDYPAVKERVRGWTIGDVTKGFEPHLRYLLLSISLNVFGNIRVVPLVVSIALLVLTYYITAHMANKRFAGVVAMVILLQSAVFLTYDTSATYDNSWILLYVLSLYLIFKKWPLSSLSYVLTLPSKALTAMFFPMTFFFIYRSEIPREKKIRTAISYIIILMVGIVVLALGVDITRSNVGFDGKEFLRGFTVLAFQLRFDGLVLIFILPLIVVLFMVARKGIRQADSVMVLILGILLSAPLLDAFTDLTNQPYRFVPLIVFFAMGIGTILARKTIEQV
ncbi:MAG: hypothetical protein ACRD92_04810 [Nitrosopumilaceae archaeon]